MEDVDITNDTELKDYVRGVTLYDEGVLSPGELDTLIGVSKLILKNKVGDSNWFVDSGLGLALLGVTCAKTKAAVENHSVQSWDIAGANINIEARDQNGNAVQYKEYEDMIQTGLKSSNSGSMRTPRVSNDYHP